MKVREYTVKMYVYRIRLMFKREYPCKCCPKRKGFRLEKGYFLLWKNNPCHICKNFLGLNISALCPCYMFPGGDAITRSNIAIMRYLEKEINNA